jgi:hypothetical protein
MPPDAAALMRMLLAWSEPAAVSDYGSESEPFDQEPPDAETVEAAVTAFAGALASACTDGIRAAAGYDRVQRLVDNVSGMVAAGGPFADDWLDVLLYLGDQAVDRMPPTPAPLRIALLVTLIGLHLDNADATGPDSSAADPYIALRYCGEALELLDGMDEPEGWLAPLFLLCGRCHRMIASAGRSDSATAATEAVRALTHAAEFAGAEDGRAHLRALALSDLARVYVDRATARYEAFEDTESPIERDYPRAVAAYREAIEAAGEASAAGVAAAALTGRHARLELADILIRGLTSPRSPRSPERPAAAEPPTRPDGRPGPGAGFGILEPETAAEASELLDAVLSVGRAALTDYANRRFRNLLAYAQGD